MIVEGVFTTEYFGYKVRVDKREGDYWPCYLFNINFGDGWHSYLGVPNYCDTIRSALKRAWWRCKWRKEGKWPYKTMAVIPELGGE
jgi:hypothetical protein